MTHLRKMAVVAFAAALAGSCVGFAPIAIAGSSRSAHGAQASRADRFLASAIAFRAIAIAAPDANTVPKGLDLGKPNGNDIAPKDRRRAWIHFFRAAVVKAGCLKSAQPIAVYYNPIVDVVFVTQWRDVAGKRFEISAGRIETGDNFEQSGGRNASTQIEAGPSPATLRALAQRRLTEFSRRYPIDHATHCELDPVSASGPKVATAEERVYSNAALTRQLSDRASADLRLVTEALGMNESASCKTRMRSSGHANLEPLCLLNMRFRSGLVLQGAFGDRLGGGVLMAGNSTAPALRLAIALAPTDEHVLHVAHAILIREG